MSDNAIKSTTQEFLDVYDIVNDMVLLKDGTAAVILQIGTMNFSLLAEQEQDAIIFTYGSLLNSLNYPIQINIQSQTKDATKYLRLLDEQIAKTNSDRKAALIKQYRDFVAALIKERNVLQKRFFIIVPAGPAEMGLFTPTSVIPGKTAFDITSVEKSILVEKATNLLEPRKEHLTSQFNRLGLYARQLSTQEIIQNFYINYNPEAVEGQEISSSENYTTPLVRASFGGKIMQTNNQTSVPGQINNPNQAVGQSSAAAPSDVNKPQFTPEEIIGMVNSQTVETPQTSNDQQAINNQAETQLQEEPVSLMPEPNTPPQTIQAAQNVQLETPVNNEPSFSTEPPVQQTQDLNLNLDANLLQNPPLGTAQTETAYGESPSPVSDFTSPEPAQEAQTVSNQEPIADATDNNFAEEITPLQNKFETPTIDDNQQSANN